AGYRLDRLRPRQWPVPDRQSRPRRGRSRLSRRRSGARHPLWRRQRRACGDDPGGAVHAIAGASWFDFSPRSGLRISACSGALLMTYCCGILVRDGLVMIADTRTNAGLDNISVFRKLHVFAVPNERIMAIASSGNLSVSQSVVSTLSEGLENTDTGEVETLL